MGFYSIWSVVILFLEYRFLFYVFLVFNSCFFFEFFLEVRVVLVFFFIYFVDYIYFMLVLFSCWGCKDEYIVSVMVVRI